MVSLGMPIQPGIGAAAETKREAVVWRWMGTRADIVRIAKAIQETVGATSFELELTDALGTSKLADLSTLEQELDRREKLKTLAIVAASSQKLCKTVVVFDAAGVHTKAAVTVISSGMNPSAVDDAHATALRMVSAGEREPKGVEPSEIEKWAGISILAAPVGVVLLWISSESGDPGLILLGFALAVLGMVALYAYLAYESLVPQVELLRPGQKSRLYESAKWLALTVAGIAVTALVTGAIKL